MVNVEVIKRIKFTEINRISRLPIPGKVLVELGETVQPGDVIAEAKIPTRVQILDIARGLGVHASDAASYMMRDLGEVVQKDDVIAQSTGKLPRIIRAPMGGKLLDWTNGRVTLASEGKSEFVKAGMIGEVAEIIMNYGAVLRAYGCLIQGVWGNGRVGSGLLTLLDSRMESHIEEVMLDYFEEGQVLAAGHCLQVDHLDVLAKKGISGLILCSMPPELIQAAVEQPYPIIVLQGFGRIPPDPLSVSLLSGCMDELVSINACGRDKDKGERPEVVIPLNDNDFEDELPPRVELMPGQWVQVGAGKAIGKTGEVMEISQENSPFESGMNVPSAKIRLFNDEEITVPGGNLVLLSNLKPE